MICKPCREGAWHALVVLFSPSGYGREALSSAMREHDKCKGSTWCDCQHKTPEAP